MLLWFTLRFGGLFVLEQGFMGLYERLSIGIVCVIQRPVGGVSAVSPTFGIQKNLL